MGSIVAGPAPLGAKFASPGYHAVMLPVAVEVASIAVNVDPWATSGAVPIAVVPLRNCTVPLGEPAPGNTTLTVAVKGPPGMAVSEVEVAACATVTTRGEDGRAW
jgi:hypothetical protein